MVSAAELDIALEPRPEAASEARRALEQISSTISPGMLEDLKLMVSELVTNSYRHAGLTTGEEIRLRLEMSGDCIHVEVEDPGRFARPKRPASNGSGLGLRIVERLADRWGIRRNEGTLVWFEMSGESTRRRPAPR